MRLAFKDHLAFKVHSPWILGWHKTCFHGRYPKEFILQQLVETTWRLDKKEGADMRVFLYNMDWMDRAK